MRVVVLDHLPEDPNLRKAWNLLAFGMEPAEVFYTYEWAIAVQRAYKGSLRPLLFLGYDNTSLVGVAAFAQKSTGEVVFLGAETGDYCEFLCASNLRREFVHTVLSELNARGVVKAVFTNLPADSLSVSVLREACLETGYYLHMREAYACAQVRLGSAEERQELKQSFLGKRKLRRNFRELAKRGNVMIQHHTEWGEIRPLLGQFARAHIARFLETGKKSSLIRQERRKFLDELGFELSRSGWIVFSRLIVDDITAAWNYGFRFAGSWFWYQPTLNDRYRDFSPGHSLLAKIVEEACDSPDLNLVDLGLGAEGYKERFANSRRRTLYCEVNRSRVRHWRTLARHRAAAVATASSSVETQIRSMISAVNKIRAMAADGGILAVLKHVSRRMGRRLFSYEKIHFFEWSGSIETSASEDLCLAHIDSDALAAAAVQYEDDPACLQFLMRSAQRLRSEAKQGFALTSRGVPVHFCWAEDAEGFFLGELDRKLRDSCKNGLMIFDNFTPQSVRGRGYFAKAIEMLASHLSLQGKTAWIAGRDGDQTAIQSILKAGFQYRFTLGRRRMLFFDKPSDPMQMPVSSCPEPGLATIQSRVGL